MTIGSVVSANSNCNWDGSGGPLRTGQMDLISVASPGGAIGHSRRYPIGVQWGLNSSTRSEASDEPGGAFGDSFITLKDVEVRLVFDDAVVLQPTDETRANLPASYVVPTMGTQDVGTPPIAVFDLIPTWVTQRLALDRRPGRYQHGLNLGNRVYRHPVRTPARHRVSTPRAQRRGQNGRLQLVQWVVSLCRGCRSASPARPIRRRRHPGFPGHYGADEPADPSRCHHARGSSTGVTAGSIKAGSPRTWSCRLNCARGLRMKRLLSLMNASRPGLAMR